MLWPQETNHNLKVSCWTKHNALTEINPRVRMHGSVFDVMRIDETMLVKLARMCN